MLVHAQYVLDEEGQQIINDGQALVQIMGSDELRWVQLESLEDSVNLSSETNTQVTTAGEDSGTWSDTDTLKLLNLYADNKERFASTTIKNHQIWVELTAHFPGRSVDQVRNRFKYLKIKYMKVKDNMGPNVTGTKRIQFKYFDVMDEMFGKEPNVVPLSQCDSSNATENFPAFALAPTKVCCNTAEEATRSSEEDDVQPVDALTSGRKKKVRKVDILTKKLKMKNETEEKKLEVQRAAVNALDRIALSFEKYVEKL